MDEVGGWTDIPWLPEAKASVVTDCDASVIAMRRKVLSHWARAGRLRKVVYCRGLREKMKRGAGLTERAVLFKSKAGEQEGGEGRQRKRGEGVVDGTLMVLLD